MRKPNLAAERPEFTRDFDCNSQRRNNSQTYTSDNYTVKSQQFKYGQIGIDDSD